MYCYSVSYFNLQIADDEILLGCLSNLISFFSVGAACFFLPLRAKVGFFFAYLCSSVFTNAALIVSYDQEIATFVFVAMTFIQLTIFAYSYYISSYDQPSQRPFQEGTLIGIVVISLPLFIFIVVFLVLSQCGCCKQEDDSDDEGEEGEEEEEAEKK